MSVCQITLVPSGVFTWTRLAGSTPSLNTGPDFDHTYLNTTGNSYNTLEDEENCYTNFFLSKFCKYHYNVCDDDEWKKRPVCVKITEGFQAFLVL